ncbi:MAG: aminopeptidase [Gudongella sp.]|jgi:aminopeptidase|nr:aminopeptidase [Gudongella sp.]
MSVFSERIEKYAQLIVKIGLNIKQGDPLVISAPVDGAFFVRIIAKKAYELGCSDIFINWSDDLLTRLRYENAPLEVFENFPRWKAEALEDYAKKGAKFLYLSGEDPQLLQGIDTKKISAHNKSSGIALREYMNYTMNDINSWCVTAMATTNWAKRIFPDKNDDEAVSMLWDAIFKAVRVDLDNPIEEWETHINTLTEKVNYLNKMAFTRLHYTSSNGTNLEIELPDGHIWAGGSSVNAKEERFVANMPTEEVFTLPYKYGVNGIVYSAKPLNYGGNLIEDFEITFKNGKVVSYHANKGQSLLKELLDIDEGSKYLGEVALVPFSSPIEKAGILFMNTLFDENAACHLALGKAYPTCIENGSSMSLDELEIHGVNDSVSHEDFMIGASDLTITGITKSGEQVEIFKNGEWAV